MSDSNVLEVPLPPGTTPSEADMALLTAACQSVVSICLDNRRDWFQRLKDLEKEEWRVNWSLQWQAEASKGRCCETVTAPTIDEAFARLTSLARLHTVEGCP